MKFDDLSEAIQSFNLRTGSNIDFTSQSVFHDFENLSLVCFYYLIILVFLESISKIFFRNIVFL